MRAAIEPVPGAAPFRDAATAALIVCDFAAALIAMGRPPICPCGRIELWHGAANDGGTSQGVADWYSLSHVIHGFLFYGALAAASRALRRPWPLAAGLFASLAFEGFWELVENSPMVIERYRATTASNAYAGDSVLNSVSDILFMVVGFFLARVWPAWLTVAVAIVLELAALAAVRDNLTLNVLMIVHPIDAVRDWQMAR